MSNNLSIIANLDKLCQAASAAVAVRLGFDEARNDSYRISRTVVIEGNTYRPMYDDQPFGPVFPSPCKTRHPLDGFMTLRGAQEKTIELISEFEKPTINDDDEILAEKRSVWFALILDQFGEPIDEYRLGHWLTDSPSATNGLRDHRGSDDQIPLDPSNSINQFDREYCMREPEKVISTAEAMDQEAALEAGWWDNYATATTLRDQAGRLRRRVQIWQSQERLV